MQEVSDTSYFLRVGPNKLTTIGTTIGKHTFVLSGEDLIRDEKLRGKLQKNGEISWSNGLTSRLLDPPCKEPAVCALDIDGLVGKAGRSWATTDVRRNTLERFIIHKSTDGKYCLNGSKSGANCYLKKDNKLVHESESWLFAEVMANGDLKWSHGYHSRLEGSPCAQCQVTFGDWIGQNVVVFKSEDPS